MMELLGLTHRCVSSRCLPIFIRVDKRVMIMNRYPATFPKYPGLEPYHEIKLRFLAKTPLGEVKNVPFVSLQIIKKAKTPA